MLLNEIVLFTQYEKVCIHTAKLFIEQHYLEKISFTDHAFTIGISKRKLRIGFNHLTGYSLKEYQVYLRIEKAKILLQESSMAISKIAQKTGFKKSSQFCRAFKNQVFLTPNEFRYRYGK
jgi:transcriptional regulator GlxA family with amidase domain